MHATPPFRGLSYHYPANLRHSLNRGLVAWYHVLPKYEGSPYQPDLNGNRYPAHLYNTTGAKGIAGAGLLPLFNGVNSYMTTSLTNHGLQRSYAMWLFRMSTLSSLYQVVLTKDPDTVATELIYYDNNSSTNTYRLERDATAGDYGQWALTSATPAVNEYFHFVISMDYSSFANVPSMYINGLARSVTTDHVTTHAYLTNTNSYYVGGGSSVSYPYPWRGFIHDIRIYDRLLSATEAYALFLDGFVTMSPYLNRQNPYAFFGRPGAPPWSRRPRIMRGV